MTTDNQRYEIVLDPCDRWMVWDKSLAAPAELASQPLIGLTEGQALLLSRLLDQMPSSRQRSAA